MGYQLDYTGDEVSHKLYTASMELNLSQAEPLTGDNTYQSPSTYVQVVPDTVPENFEYVDGSIKYTGDRDITVRILTTVTVSTVSGGNSITMTIGKTGTPEAKYEISNVLTNPNDEKELTNQGRLDVSTNDTMDFYIKGSSNFVLEKAVLDINKVG